MKTRREFLKTAAGAGFVLAIDLKAFCAAEAFSCEPRARASCSSRVIWYCLATFSAVTPIW